MRKLLPILIFTFICVNDLIAQHVVEVNLPFKNNSVDVVPVPSGDSLLLFIDRKTIYYTYDSFYWVNAKGIAREVKFQDFINNPILGVSKIRDSVYYYFTEPVNKQTFQLRVFITDLYHREVKTKTVGVLDGRLLGYHSDGSTFSIYGIDRDNKKIYITSVSGSQSINSSVVTFPVDILKDKSSNILFHAAKSPLLPIFSGSSTKIFQDGKYLWVTIDESFPVIDPSIPTSTSVYRVDLTDPKSILVRTFQFTLPDILSANSTLANGKLVRVFSMGSKMAFEVFDFDNGKKLFSKVVQQEDVFPATYKYRRGEPGIHPGRNRDVSPFSRLRADFISADSSNDGSFYLAFGASRTKWKFVPNYASLLLGIPLTGYFTPGIFNHEEIFRYCYLRANVDGTFDFTVDNFLPKKVDDLELAMFNNEPANILAYLHTDNFIYGVYKPTKRAILRIVRFQK